MVKNAFIVTTISLILSSMMSPSMKAQQTSSASSTPEGDQRTYDELLSRPVTMNVEHVSRKRALDAAAASAGVVIQYRVQVIDAYPSTVTVRAENRPLRDVLDQVLEGTTLSVVRVKGAPWFAVVETSDVAPQQGTGSIVGTITNRQTKQPMNGVVVVLDSGRTSRSGTAGMYRFANVQAGPHRVKVRFVGYAKQSKPITIGNNETVTVDFALEQNLNTLAQVVVTGTVMPTKLKAVPNAITVITAKQIEERGITRIDQLFRGDVPGVFSLNSGSGAGLDNVIMFSRGATALERMSAGTGNGTNPIKTYVDGIEMADPQYLSQIDPRNIERIEILTGPQASTIYGSNALNGVMQIFTKRGTTPRPQIALSLLSGWVENNFRRARTPQHDAVISVSGVEGRISYNAGGSWNRTGAWTPAKQTARVNAFGGARFLFPTTRGPITADLTFRQSTTTNERRGSQEQAVAAYRETGWWYPVSAFGLADNQTSKLTGQTLGATLSYAPTTWWSHEARIGRDAEDVEDRQNTLHNWFRGDTALRLQQTHAERRSLSYTTTARVPLTTIARGTVTLGVDAWQNMSTLLLAQPFLLTGSLTGSYPPFVSRQPGHNTGGFVQSQIDMWDHLFLTYGLRAEWNPTFGAEAQPNYAPRYGMSYVTDINTPWGALTAKLRASYGRSTRPPSADAKRAIAENDPNLTSVYGSYDNRMANPTLGPEHQQGGEGGVELYFGSRFSVVVTRYNQTVDGLIASIPGVDSVRSLQANPSFLGLTCAQIMQFNVPQWCSSQDAAGHWYAAVGQNINAASIRNQGWELQSSITTGPITTHGTYSWTKSRTIGITPEFLARFSSLLHYVPQYRRGATYQLLPEHTWAATTTYARAKTTVSFNVAGVGRFRIYDDNFYARNLDGGIRLNQNRQNISDNLVQNYVSMTPGYALMDITASHRVTESIEGVVQLQNIANRYSNDITARQAAIGRQTKIGLRIRH
jgi:outer membrane receptor protein involved in Fe transport